jgi:hypothetical protein
MSLEGRVQDGVVVFTRPGLLREGTRVRGEPVSAEQTTAGNGPWLLAQLGDVVGAVDDLPDDLAAQHDHYLYGAPKRP